MIKVLYVAGREKTYSRTHNLLTALTRQGLQVTGCFPPDRSFRHYPKLIIRAIYHACRSDVVIVGFYGQLILPFIRMFTFKPIIFDMYVATYDTMVEDRAKAKPGSWQARLYKFSDMVACRLSTLIVLETHDHIRDFAKKFNVPVTKFRRIFLCVDSDIIRPLPHKRENSAFVVHFHGEYAPFHGVDTIVRAAFLLKDKNVIFQIVGRGITFDRDFALAKELGVDTIRFIEPVPYHELAQLMARADVCLGIFGSNQRMLRVTTNKVIESIAMKKPLITAKNQPVQELLTHKKSAYLIDRANPKALAQAILYLKDHSDVRERIAEEGYRVFQQNCTLDQMGSRLVKMIEKVEE